MDMEPIGVAPVGDGKHTEITVSMTAADAARFLDLYSRGKLAELGVVDAKVVDPVPAPDQKERWTDHARQRTSGESSSPSRNQS